MQTPIKTPSKISKPTDPPAARDLKATVSADEFGAVQWAAKRCRHRSDNGQLGPMPLAEFLREAVREKVRETVRAEIARGKEIPANIAHLISTR